MVTNDVMVASSAGIIPLILLNPKFKWRNDFKLPIVAGIGPVKLFMLKLISVTVLFSTVIPCQVATSLVKSQLVFQVVPFVDLCKSISAFFSKSEICE